MKKLCLLCLLIMPVIIHSQEVIEIDPGSFTFSFEDPIEYPFLKIDTTKIWQIVEPNKTILFLPNNMGYGKMAIISDTNNFYSNNLASSFQLKVGLGEVYEEYEIRFDHKYDFEENKDGGIIETSYDTGLTWQNIISDTVIQNNLLRDNQGLYTSSNIISSYDNQPGYTGLCDEMTKVYIRFKSSEFLKGKTMLLRFTISSDGNNAGNEGWMIDELILIGNYRVSIKDLVKPQSNIRIFSGTDKDILNIQSDFKRITQVEIISATGEIKQKERGSNINAINISKLLPGIYLVVCQSQDKNRWITKINII